MDRAITENNWCAWKSDLEHTLTADAHGWIQWKGTNVCIDIWCACGKHTHFDGDFMYFVQCGYCKKVYKPQTSIALYEVKNPNWIKDLKTTAKDEE